MFADDVSLSRAVWRKSSRSNGDGNVCIEVAFIPGATAIRDSKDPHGMVLVVDAAQWSRFTAMVRGPRRPSPVS